MVTTATHLNRFHVETNRYTVAVSVNGIHGYSLTYYSLGIVETTSPIWQSNVERNCSHRW